MLTTYRYKIDDATEMIGHEIVDPATSASILKLALEHGSHIASSAKKNKKFKF